MILDLMAAIYCIAAEREEFRLVPYALFYRLIFILLIDITKAMATIEEFLGFQMSWGKLERAGLATSRRQSGGSTVGRPVKNSA